jgi:hypothetical protein
MVHWMVESFRAMLENFGHQIFDSLIWGSKFSITQIGNQKLATKCFKHCHFLSNIFFFSYWINDVDQAIVNQMTKILWYHPKHFWVETNFVLVVIKFF